MFRKRSKSDVQTEYQCTVRFLDDSDPIQIQFVKDTAGQVVIDRVCDKLNLVEKDYFGLRYVDADKQRHWLDPLKTVYRQLKGMNPMILVFRVKFYPEGPSKLHEEITRYFLFLQLRRDLQHGRLLCSPVDAHMLAALIIQSEVGDYDIRDHPPGYVTEFKMLPKQTMRMEEQITDMHKTLAGQVPADAESKFVTKSSTLDTYGVDPHQVKDQKGTSLYLGVTHQGIMTFQGNRRTSLYKWGQIRRTNYDGKNFIVHVNVTEDDDVPNSKKKQQAIGFKCPTLSACKYLWKCAVEQQLFFTLPSSVNVPKMKSSTSLFSRGSKFRFSGRCQNEAIAASGTIQRAEPSFNRSSSLPNFARKTDSKSSLKTTPFFAEQIAEANLKNSLQNVQSKSENITDSEDVPVKFRESAVDVPNVTVTNTEVIHDGPVLQSEVVKVEVPVVESLPDMIPVVEETTAARDAANVAPIYEPEVSILSQHEDDNNIGGKRLSLDDQIKQLEQQWDRIRHEQSNNVGDKKVGEETVKAASTLQAEATPNHKGDNSIAGDASAKMAKPRRSCCRVIVYTFFFLFVTTAVSILFLVRSDIQHPYVSEMRAQLRHIEPMRDYINNQVQSLFKS